MNRIIIGAPFGAYFSYPGATSTLGTFTLHYRGAWPYRIWRCLRTLRYSWRTGGWVNRLGLPNPGIQSLDPAASYADKIISVHGFDRAEWAALVNHVAVLQPLAVELNLSCPNVGSTPDKDVLAAISDARVHGLKVIAKLPPLGWSGFVQPLFDAGVRCFHCCNTIPVAEGGLSGKPVKQYAISIIEDLRWLYDDDITIIGGGGVTHEQDYRDYRAAGADQVAIASVLLNPLNWRRVRRLVEKAREDA